MGLNAMWRRDGEYIGFEALIPCSLMSLLSCVRVCGMTLTFKGQYVQSTLKKMIWLSSTRRRTASLQRHYLHFCISKASKVSTCDSEIQGAIARRQRGHFYAQDRLI